MTRLLLVDDDVQLRAGMSAYLRRVGLEVLEAGSCAEGRQLQLAQHPDLTIVDYDLPDGTALDVLQSMRERDAVDSALFRKGSVIDRKALYFDRSLEPDATAQAPLTLEEAERRHIADTLQQLGGRVDEAARALGISRSALYAKLEKYRLGPSA